MENEQPLSAKQENTAANNPELVGEVKLEPEEPYRGALRDEKVVVVRPKTRPRIDRLTIRHYSPVDNFRHHS